MPIIQFQPPPGRGNRVTKHMSTPKRMHDVNVWFRDARRASPDLNALMESEGESWFIDPNIDITIDYIKYTLYNNRHERAHVVITRKSD